MNPPVFSTHARLRSLLPQHQQELFDRVSRQVKENPSILDNRGQEVSQEAQDEGTPSNV